MSNPNNFGDFIKSLRVSSGFKTQKSLCDAAGVSSATLSRIESGDQEPTPSTLAALSRHLKGYTYEELQAAAGWMDQRVALYLGADENKDILLNIIDYSPIEKINLYREISPHLVPGQAQSGQAKEIEESEFKEFLNNTEHGLFFKELLDAPEERIKELRQIWNIIKKASESE